MIYLFCNKVTLLMVRVIRDERGVLWRTVDGGPETISSEAQLAEMQGNAVLWEPREVPPPKPLDWPNGAPSDRGGEGFSRDSDGNISDAGFHADILGDDD